MSNRDQAFASPLKRLARLNPQRFGEGITLPKLGKFGMNTTQVLQRHTSCVNDHS